MKRGAPDHWKMADLARRVNVPEKYALAWANGTLERLWHFAALCAPRGDIGKVPNQMIARACAWPESECELLIDALISSRWLERSGEFRLTIHDWTDHCEDSAHTKLARRHEFFFDGRKPKITGIRKEESKEISEWYSRNPFKPVATGVNPLQPVATPENPFTPSSLAVPSLANPSNTEESVKGSSNSENRHTHTNLRARAKASDLEGPVSQRFDEFWKLYPLQVDKDQACGEWVSAVTVDNEAAVFSCLDRYLASDQVHRGVISKAHGWLQQQRRDKWESRWPESKSNGHSASKVARITICPRCEQKPCVCFERQLEKERTNAKPV